MQKSPFYNNKKMVLEEASLEKSVEICRIHPNTCKTDILKIKANLMKQMK
jgi:hypothetical protein